MDLNQTIQYADYNGIGSGYMSRDYRTVATYLRDYKSHKEYLCSLSKDNKGNYFVDPSKLIDI